MALPSYLISPSLSFLICKMGKLYQPRLTIFNLSALSEFWGHQPPQFGPILWLQGRYVTWPRQLMVVFPLFTEWIYNPHRSQPESPQVVYLLYSQRAGPSLPLGLGAVEALGIFPAGWGEST